ncbi:hypothetical protein, partial [Escherichia coli]|uniref:hypothetical protein n=1 Tax=Escherichia coli TaxID=562 RepID=UPI001BFC8D3C
ILSQRSLGIAWLWLTETEAVFIRTSFDVRFFVGSGVIVLLGLGARAPAQAPWTGVVIVTGVAADQALND